MTAETPRAKDKAGHAIDRDEVGAARPFQDETCQLGAVGTDDLYPTPELDFSHHVVDVQEPKFSSAAAGGHVRPRCREAHTWPSSD
jgi:hypothetical protein